MGKRLYLKDGDRVAVVGAGPSGTFFSKFLTDFAREENKNLSITIFDGKQFSIPGPRGCNMCAGVISPTLLDKLHKTGITLPPKVIQRDIEGYKLITKAGNIVLKALTDKNRIVTVFRGCGPIDTEPSETGGTSFDDFLLGYVRTLGIEVISHMVWDIHIPDGGKKNIRLGYGANRLELSELEVDAVIVACGLQGPLLNKLETLGFGYKQPRCVGACQTELRLSKGYIDERFKNMINVYSLGIPHIKFAALVPKRCHLTVTLVGDRELRKPDMLEFLSHPLVRKDLPPQWDWQAQTRHCLCMPKIPLTASQNPFTDRLCIIGDASYSRLYKNGLESALQTSRFAAQSILRYGVSKRSFLHSYYANCKKTIISDNAYGRFVFWINDRIVSYPLITQSHIKFARNEKLLKRRLKLCNILWNVLTGDIPYRQIFLKMLNPWLQFRLNLYTLANVFSKTGKRSITLLDNQVVVIIGGGPSGSSCAIALLKEAKRLSKRIRVIIYEPKDFEAFQNQCVGVLSPPFEELLKDKLGIDLPSNLIQRRISGYILHSNNDSVCLEGEDITGPTYVVRRSEFDRFLLSTAESLGAELIRREVTDIEFYPDYIRVFSGNYNHEASVVVGAFGVNNADILELLESETKYIRPKSLRSVITNIHADKDFINQKLNNNIYVFLPPIKNIEFAAITAKYDHITVNICGANVSSKDMNSFLRLTKAKDILPEYEGLVYFKGSFPISPARGIFRDRFVLVGDSGGLIRPLKGKGINSAIITGVRAADTIMNTGISKAAFLSYYRSCHDLIDDTNYGIVLRFLCNASSRLNILDRLVRLAKKDLILYRAFYNIISGHQTYKKIVQESVSFKFFFRVIRTLLLG